MIVRETVEGVEVLAPAKLNLYLEILGKRPDGYHEIETLMVAVNLHDRLSFADNESGAITLTCDDPRMPTGATNLVVKAAERLKASTGSNRGAAIVLKKVIPAEAGLAGGSSDAAATLVGLDRLWGLNASAKQLETVAAEVGSDVAFFLNGPAAICRGRGEQVEALSLRSPLHFVLVCPPVGLSTADVYRNLTLPDRPRSIGPVIEALDHGGPAALGGSLFNRLQPTAESIRPALTRVRDALAELSHDLEFGPPLLEGHLMSGSGSAYFGLARDLNAANIAAGRLEALGLGSVRVITCGP